MITKLENGKRLIRGGTIGFTDGTKEVFYFIVAAGEASPELVVQLEKGKCLVLAGTITDAETLEEARERFRIAQGTGKTPPRTKQPTPYYIIAEASKSGLTIDEKAVCDIFARDMTEAFKEYSEGGNA